MIASPDETKNLAGENVLRLIQIRLATLSLQKISLVRQDNFAARASAIAHHGKSAGGAWPRAHKTLMD
jgi:hypothetical protein